MSVSPDPAAPVLISSLHSIAQEKKVRIAGRFLSYESDTQLILVQDETNDACLVDVSLLLDDLVALPTLRRSKSTVFIIGYPEVSQVELPIPVIPAFMDAPNISPALVVRAILLTPAPDLNLTLWREGIRQREAADTHRLSVTS